MLRLSMLITLMIITCGLMPNIAMAKRTTPLTDAEIAAQEKQKIFDKIEEVSEGRGNNVKMHFHMMYTNHNIIETVQLVQNDVQNAIKKCGENNPDMKKTLNARYDEWNDVLSPVMKEAKSHLENMKKAQDYAKKSDLDFIFNGLNKLRKDSNDKIKKIPVTTPEACEFLMKKIDETQEGMRSMLRDTLVTMPQEIEENIRAEEKAAKEKAKEKEDAEIKKDAEKNTDKDKTEKTDKE